MSRITVISGFLGAGKTTLIKKLLKEAFEGEKVVLIENEFGEIGIDGGFLKEAGIQITEMNSGCICCSLTGDFKEALRKVEQEYKPERILIEPSGVGKLSDVLKAVEACEEEGMVLDSGVAVVDATKYHMYAKNFGEFFNNQIENASTILLSRTQNMSEEKLADVLAHIKEQNHDANVITTPWDQLDGKRIVEVMERENLEIDEHHHHHEHHHDHDEECCCHHEHEHEEECTCGHEHNHEHHHEHEGECCCGHDHDHEHEHHHHHADEVFESFGFETTLKYSKDKLETILTNLSNDTYGTVLRCKGIVPAQEDTWYYFDMVPQECEIREGQPDFTGRIVVIGSHVNKEAVKEAFQVK